MSLISTSDLRVYLSIEEGDRGPNEKLDSLAKSVEDFVDSFTNRKLEAQRYSSDPHFTYLDGTGESSIYLPQYPISYVYQANVDSEREHGSANDISLDDIFYYPNGKLISEAGYFTKGRRNVKVDYLAGYAPVVNGTFDSSVSTYPIPLDLKQVMIEMTVETFKEGLTAIHTVSAGEHGDKIIRLLSQNSFWSNVLNKYKNFSACLEGED